MSSLPRRLAWRRACIFSLAFGLLGSTAAAQEPRPLPLTRVRMYETGVGYFERTGALASGGVALPVPAGHLDDALKTLVVLSADGNTTVSGIEFASSVSRDMARALAGLPESDDESSVSYRELLTSLEGAPVEVRTATGTLKGKLVDVNAPEGEDGRCLQPGPAPAEGGEPSCLTRAQTSFVVLTTDGEIHRLRADQVLSVRPADPASRARLSSALDGLSQRGTQTRRDVRVMARTGEKVTLGYVAEAPVWRATYRVVMDDAKDEAVLQGWALLHNDTDEDWRAVRVELVNGQPDSFLFPLAAPRYARRELVTPNRELSTVPQLFDRTVDNMWSTGHGGLSLSGIGEGGGGRGEGIGLGRMGSIGHGGGVPGPLPSSVLNVGNLAETANAGGVETGALFQYTLPSRIDLRAHGSALLPFLSQKVSATRLAYVEKPDEPARSGVHVVNDSRQTLPPGTLSVFEGGGFAGESALSRTKPGESRVVVFGVDLDVELEKTSSSHVDEPRAVAFEGGKLAEHFLRKHRLSYTLENRSGAARHVYLELPFVQNAAVRGADRVRFDDERDKAYAVFDIDPRTKKEPTLEVDEGLRRVHAVESLTSERLAALYGQESLPSAQRGLLRAAAERAAALEKTRREQAAAAQELSRAEEDIEQLRHSVRALGQQKTQAGERLGQRLLAAEDGARALRTRRDELSRQQDRDALALRESLSKLKTP